MSTVTAEKLESIAEFVKQHKKAAEERGQTTEKRSRKSEKTAPQQEKRSPGRPKKDPSAQTATKSVDHAGRANAKIDKLRAKLPVLDSTLVDLPERFSALDSQQLLTVRSYLDFETKRRSALEAAHVREAVPTLEVGDKVLINYCLNSKFVGRVGTVTNVRRIRAFVEVPGERAQAYVFISNLEKVGNVEASSVGDSATQTTDDDVSLTGTDG